MNPRRLYRSRHDRKVAGVAGGMADYLGVDPTVVRILWVLSFFLGGFTLVLYIVMAFVVPEEPFEWTANAAGGTTPSGQPIDPSWTPWEPGHRPEHRHGGNAGLYFGILLVIFGAIALADQLIPGWSDGGRTGPALLVALGGVLLVASLRRGAVER